MSRKCEAPRRRGGEMSDASPLAAASDACTAALLDHPAFATWFWQASELYGAAQRLGRRHTLSARRAQVRALAATHFGPELVNLYQRRLAGMARWLALAFQPEAVALAREAGRRLADGGAGREFVCEPTDRTGTGCGDC